MDRSNKLRKNLRRKIIGIGSALAVAGFLYPVPLETKLVSSDVKPTLMNSPYTLPERKEGESPFDYVHRIFKRSVKGIRCYSAKDYCGETVDDRLKQLSGMPTYSMNILSGIDMEENKIIILRLEYIGKKRKCDDLLIYVAERGESFGNNPVPFGAGSKSTFVGYSENTSPSKSSFDKEAEKKRDKRCSSDFEKRMILKPKYTRQEFIRQLEKSLNLLTEILKRRIPRN